MYTYQCSREACLAQWTLNQGKLNGFVLTCPVCGKGRGIFASQGQRVLEKEEDDNMTIVVNLKKYPDIDEVNRLIEEFRTKHAFTIFTKNIEKTDDSMVILIKYKI